MPIGGASGVVALRRAARAVQAATPRSSPASPATPTTSIPSARCSANFSQFARDAVYPYGSGGPERELRLHHRALHAHYGATREDFGKICVAQRANALKFPHALFKKPLTLEEYLGARPIAEPHAPVRLRHALRRRRGLPGDARGARARRWGCRAARLLGTIERHNAFADDPVQMRGGWAMDRDELYARRA